jgi:hypothetical protein
MLILASVCKWHMFIKCFTQNLLQPFTTTFCEMRCHVVIIRSDETLHLCFLVYKLTLTHEVSQFCLQMVLIVPRIKYTFSGAGCRNVVFLKKIRRRKNSKQEVCAS